MSELYVMWIINKVIIFKKELFVKMCILIQSSWGGAWFSRGICYLGHFDVC